jgi:hypothetical protein
MKKVIVASFLALVVVGLSQRPAAANFCVYRPCIEIPIPPFPLPIPNVKITCIKCPCEQYHAPNPWYTYYPPSAYGPYAHVYYPAYGAPPASTLPPAPNVVPMPVPPPPPPAIRPANAPNADKGVVPTSATRAAAQSTKQSGKQYASAKDYIAETVKGMKPTQAPEAARQQAPGNQPSYQMIPVAGSDNYPSSVPSYWYGR